MNIIFIFLCIIHILVWTFVLLAFINKTTAFINLYIVIPSIYIYYIYYHFTLFKNLKKQYIQMTKY